MDKKSEAALRFVKSKDETKNEKTSQRSDLKVRSGQRMITGSKLSKNCGCNSPCACGRYCGCQHNCKLNKYNPRNSYYYASPRANCSDNWLSDYSPAQFSDSSACAVDCTGGYAYWNSNGFDMMPSCNSMSDSDSHATLRLRNNDLLPYSGTVSYSYRGTSPYIDQYEKAINRKRISHLLHDGVYF